MEIPPSKYPAPQPIPVVVPKKAEPQTESANPPRDKAPKADNPPAAVVDLQVSRSYTFDDSANAVVVVVADGEGKPLRQVPSETSLRNAKALDAARRDQPFVDVLA